MTIHQSHGYAGYPASHCGQTYGQRYDKRPPPAPKHDPRPQYKPAPYGATGHQGKPSGPTYRPPPNKPPLPAGWTPLWANQYQRWYYANAATGKTQWEAPGFEKRGDRTKPERPARRDDYEGSEHPAAGAAGGYEQPAYEDQNGLGAYGAENGMTGATGDNSGENYNGTDRAAFEAASERYEATPASLDQSDSEEEVEEALEEPDVVYAQPYDHQHPHAVVYAPTYDYQQALGYQQAPEVVYAPAYDYQQAYEYEAPAFDYYDD